MTVVAGRVGIPAPASRRAGDRRVAPVATPGQQAGPLLVGAVRGEGQRPAAQRLPDRQVDGAGAGLAEQHRELRQTEALATVLLGHREREQAGRGERRPVRVELPGGAVERLAWRPTRTAPLASDTDAVYPS